MVQIAIPYAYGCTICIYAYGMYHTRTVRNMRMVHNTIIVIGVSFVTAIIPFSFVVFAAPIISVTIFAYVLRHLLLLPFLLRVFLLP